MGKVQGERKLNRPASRAIRDNTRIPDFGSLVSGWNGLNEELGADSGADSEDPVDLPNKLPPEFDSDDGSFCSRGIDGSRCFIESFRRVSADAAEPDIGCALIGIGILAVTGPRILFQHFGIKLTGEMADVGNRSSPDHFVIFAEIVELE